mgnify:CR=1 FL=1
MSSMLAMLLPTTLPSVGSAWPTRFARRLTVSRGALMPIATMVRLIASGETRVIDAKCAADSFPGYAETLRGLGAEIEQLALPPVGTKSG